jgi:hypothetical protein
MDRFAMLVEAGAPGVVPQTTPVGLFFETYDIGDIGTFLLRRLESPELSQTAGAGTDDCHTFTHVSSNYLILIGKFWY